jgi:hypothetical protein
MQRRASWRRQFCLTAAEDRCASSRALLDISARLPLTLGRRALTRRRFDIVPRAEHAFKLGRAHEGEARHHGVARDPTFGRKRVHAGGDVVVQVLRIVAVASRGIGYLLRVEALGLQVFTWIPLTIPPIMWVLIRLTRSMPATLSGEPASATILAQVAAALWHTTC